MKNDILHPKREFANMRELIEWAGEEYSDRTAYSYKKHPKDEEVISVSFSQFRDDVRALTSSLIKMGCTGKHCVIIGKLSYEWAKIYYAVLCAGGTLVPLDRDWSEEELAKTAARADTAFLFCDKDIEGKAEYISGRIKLLHAPVLLCGRGSGEGLDLLTEAGKNEFAVSGDLYRNLSIDPYRMSLLVFTSGTTGEGKGVMLSQNAILSDICDVVPYMDFSGKTVGVLPPHHTYGSSVMLVGHVLIGCEVYISSGLLHVQKELKANSPGHLVLVPLYLETFYRKIWANIRAQGKEKLILRMIKISNFLLKLGIDLRRKIFKSVRDAFGGEVKMIISGGAPINAEIITFFEAMGISTLNGYGITECAPIIAVNRSKRSVMGSVGPVLPIDTVRIDEPNSEGEGEILVKGPNVMLGYYKNEEATSAAMTEDGYFRTGDYGKLIGDVLFITGRKKNLIILSNGKNVYPEEIENELIATPGVLDIIVYEGQSRRGYEYNAIVAEIYPDKEYIEKNGITDIRAHLKKYVDEYNRTCPPYKKIGVLKVRDTEFPKNTLRKIMRFKLDMSID
ncbi:MAG: AMP-binding protein [Clostridia bacterium]|nr:AMP-binding protein [Clostridia bacterium]